MRSSTFSIPYSVVEKLPPSERFVYYELCRLATPQAKVDEEFRVQIPAGACISSNLRLSKILDFTYAQTARAIEDLLERNLIELTPLDTDSEYQTFFIIQIKEVYMPWKKMKEQILRP